MAMYMWEGSKIAAFEKEQLPEWHIGQPVPEISSRVITFQADGHELALILDSMKRNIEPISLDSPTYNELSRQLCAAKYLIKDVKKEAFKMQNQNFASLSGYPVLTNLATDFAQQDVTKMDITELATLLGQKRKIDFLREIRRRFQPMGLLEAKLLADGMWRRQGWE